MKTKLFAEIDAAAAAGRLSNPVTFDQARELPYLQAVMHEGMRLYPAIATTLPRVVPPEGLYLNAGKRGELFAPKGVGSLTTRRFILELMLSYRPLSDRVRGLSTETKKFTARMRMSSNQSDGLTRQTTGTYVGFHCSSFIVLFAVLILLHQNASFSRLAEDRGHALAGVSLDGVDSSNTSLTLSFQTLAGLRCPSSSPRSSSTTIWLSRIPTSRCMSTAGRYPHQSLFLPGMFDIDQSSFFVLQTGLYMTLTPRSRAVHAANESQPLDGDTTKSVLSI